MTHSADPEEASTNRNERPAEGDRSSTPSRRELLATVGTVAGAGMLAGCPRGLRSQTFEATPVVLTAPGRELLELTEFDLTEQSRTESVGDIGEATVMSYLSVHDRPADGDPPVRFDTDSSGHRTVGTLSTPAPSALGDAVNPFASEPLSELIGGQRGRELLEQFDVVDTTEFEWARRPERTGTREVELLGATTEAESYMGVVADDQQPETLLMNVARVSPDSDAVIAAEVTRRLTPPDPIERDVECADDLCQMPSPRQVDMWRRYRRIAGYMTTCTEITTGDTGIEVCGATGGGGSGGTDTSSPTASPVPATFSITNARLVQQVEETVVEEPGKSPIYTEDDPDLVRGQNTALVFEFDTIDHPDLENMNGPLELEVYSGDPGSNSQYELEGSIEFESSHLEAIENGEHTISVLHRISNDSTGNELPVFELENGMAEISPKTTPDQSHWDTSGLSLTHAYGAGSNTIREVEPLKVGFIALRDAPPSPFKDPGDRYGDASGRVRDRERSFRSATEYLQRVYPGDVVTYLHTDATAPGAARKLAIGSIKRDMKAANNVLDNIATGGVFSSSTFPSGGTINLDGNDRSTMVNEIRNNGFDVTVAIVPGVATNNSGVADYYNYHGEDPGLVGRAYVGAGKAVGVEGANPNNSDPVMSVTAAHEIGHYFQDDYEGPSDHPMAQRRNKQGTLQQTVDGKQIYPAHARHQDSSLRGINSDPPGVVSTAYDLRPPPASSLEGFANMQHYTNDGGDFSVDGPGWKSTPTDSIAKVPSFMSYTGDDAQAWTDARIHQQLIDRGSGTSGGSGWSANASSGSGSAHYMLSATGEVTDDGAILYDNVMAFRGVNEYTDVDDGPVEVALLGPDDGVLRQARVPVVARPSHNRGSQDAEPVELPSFLLPFEEGGVLVRTTYEGRPAFMNPIDRSVRDAVGRVPRDGFGGDPETAGEEIEEALNAMASRMTDGAYAGAADAMDGRVRERIRENVVDYEPRLGERSLEGLLSLVDEMVGRLQGVAETSG